MSRRRKHKPADPRQSKVFNTTFFDDWGIYDTVKHIWYEYTLPPPNDGAFSIRNIVDPATLVPIWADPERKGCEYIGGYTELFDASLLERMVYEDGGVVNAVYDCASHARQYVYMKEVERQLTRMFLHELRPRWQRERDEQRSYVSSISDYFDETWKLWDVQITNEHWGQATESFRKYVPLVAKWCLQDYYVDSIWEPLLAKFVDFGKNGIKAPIVNFKLANEKPVGNKFKLAIDSRNPEEFKEEYHGGNPPITSGEFYSGNLLSESTGMDARREQEERRKLRPDEEIRLRATQARRFAAIREQLTNRAANPPEKPT